MMNKKISRINESLVKWCVSFFRSNFHFQRNWMRCIVLWKKFLLTAHWWGSYLKFNTRSCAHSTLSGLGRLIFKRDNFVASYEVTRANFLNWLSVTVQCLTIWAGARQRQRNCPLLFLNWRNYMTQILRDQNKRLKIKVTSSFLEFSNTSA